MASENELKSLYENQLKEKLRALESSRKRILNRYIITALIFVGLAVETYFLVTINPNVVLIVACILISAAFLF
jgi:NADH:ubiquinone oxidoreductase subunit 3 (subunit A)